jgi:hypothetical protein
MRKTSFPSFLLFVILTITAGNACSHKFDPNILDLDFYQWNLWEDTKSDPANMLPSCGWEDLHRGMGKLVRIPAPLGEFFPDKEASAVFWYHCRFTLPEQWEERAISLLLKEAGPEVRIFLNEVEVGFFQGKITFEVDVTEDIYYTRDNHLSIRISNPPGGLSDDVSGITGTIQIIPEVDGDRRLEAEE